MAIHINKAKEIYFQNKTELEIAKTPEDLFDMYKQYPEFNVLDNGFFKIMNSESDKIKLYIQQHINEFAIVA